MNSCAMSGALVPSKLSHRHPILRAWFMLMGRFAGPDRPADLSHAVLPRARRRLRPRLSIGWHGRSPGAVRRKRLELDATGVLSPFERRVVWPCASGCVGRVPDVAGAPMAQVNRTSELMTQIHDA